MRKIAAVLAVLASFGVLIAAAAFVSVRYLFPPEKLRAMLVDGLQNALHRQVELTDLSIGLRGLSVAGLKVSERPDFKAGTFAELERFVLRPKLSALLQKKLVIGETRVAGASLVVRQYRDGTFNFSDLMTTSTAAPTAGAAPAAGAPASPAAGAPLALAFTDVSIERLTLKYEAPDRKVSAQVEKASLKDVSLTEPFPWSVRVSVETSVETGPERGGGPKGTATLEASGTAEASRQALAVEQGTLEIGKLKAGFQARLEGASGVPASFKADVGAFGSEDLAPFAAVPPGLQVPAFSVEFKGAEKDGVLTLDGLKVSGAGGLDLRGRVSYKEKTGETAFDLASAEFDLGPWIGVHPAGRALGVGGRGSLKLKGSNAKEGVTLKSLEAALGGIRVQVAGKASAAGAFELALETNAIPLAEAAKLSKAAAEYQPTGKATLQAKVSGTAAKPKASGTVALDGVGVKYKTVAADGLAGVVTFTESSASSPELKGRLSGSPFTSRFAAALGPTSATTDFFLKIDVLDAGALAALHVPAAPLAPGAPKPAAPPSTLPPLKTTGKVEAGKVAHPNLVSGPLTMDWKLDGVTPDMKTIGGTATLRVAPGKAINLLSLAEKKGGKAMLAPLLAVEKARKLPGVKLPSVNNLDFTRIEGDYAFEKGVMTMKPFLFEGPTLTARSEGRVDLGAETLDLKVALKSGDLKPKLIVQGGMYDPKVSLDMEAVKEKVQEQAVKELKKQGEKLLKGLFK